MFRYLGWCSWDAFYTDISEDKVRAKARELYDKDVPVRWMLMDDGWLSVKDGRLYDFIPEKEKFPHGFGGMIRISSGRGTSPGVLKPLACLDGRLLMLDRPAWPAEDCVFTDPMREGVLKLTNTAAWGGAQAGGVAAFNLTDTAQKYSFSPSGVPELPGAGNYLVYDYFRKEARLCGGGDAVEAELEPGGFAWYQILPIEGDGAVLGLAEKYAGFAAVENMYATQRGMGCVMAEQGPVRFACAGKPGRVLCGGVEMTHLLEEESRGPHLGTYVVNLSPKKGRAVLEVLWNCP